MPDGLPERRRAVWRMRIRHAPAQATGEHDGSTACKRLASDGTHPVQASITSVDRLQHAHRAFAASVE
jgi:hypothetical protein